MAIVVVYTDNGQQVWQSPADPYMLMHAHCPGNTNGAALIEGLRRAILEAEPEDEGDGPEPDGYRVEAGRIIPTDR
jgi:hypothetical protein